MPIARLLLLLVVSLFTGLFLTFALTMLKMPDPQWELILGVGIGVGLLMFVMLWFVVRIQVKGFDAARNLRTATALYQYRLAHPWQLRVDPFGTAALEAAMGHGPTARDRLTREKTFGVALKFRHCIEAHIAVEGTDTRAHQQALETLLSMGSLALHGAEAYRACLLARVALRLQDPRTTQRVLDAIGNSHDREVQAAAFWVRAWFEQPLDPTHDSLPIAQRAEALADVGTPTALSAKISQRMAAVTHAGTSVAYR